MLLVLSRLYNTFVNYFASLEERQHLSHRHFIHTTLFSSLCSLIYPHPPGVKHGANITRCPQTSPNSPHNNYLPRTSRTATWPPAHTAANAMLSKINMPYKDFFPLGPPAATTLPLPPHTVTCASSSVGAKVTLFLPTPASSSTTNASPTTLSSATVRVSSGGSPVLQRDDAPR